MVHAERATGEEAAEKDSYGKPCSGEFFSYKQKVRPEARQKWLEKKSSLSLSGYPWPIQKVKMSR